MLRAAAADAAEIVAPIVDAVDRHPGKVQHFLLGLVGVEDREPNTQQFWNLWKLFADKVRRAPWRASIDREHVRAGEVISALFLGTSWKDGIRHWPSLDGYAGYLDQLFEDLPACSIVLDDYVRFLYHIGERSLPGAFIRIMKRLQQADPRRMLCKANTVYLLEILLRRHVYAMPLELKRQNDLRNAVLGLLDVLVENGSSAAFRMRDDFVTPLPVP